MYLVALKEEMLSDNEDLNTVNNELLTKVFDLSRSNNDMNNLLSGTGIATVFLDRKLRILRFNPAAAKLINLIPGDVGRPIVHIVSNLTNYSTLSKEPLWCLGSENRLVRVLVNLVGNAAEAIEGRGDVVVRTARTTFTEPHPGYENVPAGDYVIVTVTDTRCGMDAKTLSRIFEPFFSTKAPSERSGSGLGLSVVHGLVRDHEGFLDVQSVLGKGTTFTVYLPAVAPAVAVEASAKGKLPGGCERILVVDDEPGQQVLARQMLKHRDMPRRW